MPTLTEPAGGSGCLCDLCGDNSEKEIHKTDEFLYFCSDCSLHIRRWTDGKIGETMLRFLIGNVI